MENEVHLKQSFMMLFGSFLCSIFFVLLLSALGQPKLLFGMSIVMWMLMLFLCAFLSHAYYKLKKGRG